MKYKKTPVGITGTMVEVSLPSVQCLHIAELQVYGLPGIGTNLWM